MREVARQATAKAGAVPDDLDRGAVPADRGFAGDAAVQGSAAARAGIEAVSAPLVNFEGIAGADNIPILGGIPIPPDPDGDVGPNHYVQMVNTAWAVYSKTGTRLLGPASLASIWAGFEVPDCEDNSGDPIVLHDQLADRWILTQFTTAGLNVPAGTFYNCVAVSTTADPTGSYYRYAFSTGPNFPDYPKYGVWPNAYFATTREFGQVDFAGIGVYAPGAGQDAPGQPGRPGRVGPGRARHRRAGLPDRRRLAPLRLGRQPQAAGRQPQLHRRHPGRRGPLRGAVRRHQPVPVRRLLRADPHRHLQRADHPAGGRVRLRSTPARHRGPATASRSRTPTRTRHPLLPAAADLAAGLPQLRHP